MFKQPNGIEIVQPQWIEAFSQSYVATTDLSKRMAFVIAAARQNIVEKTGGLLLQPYSSPHQGHWSRWQ